MSWLVLTFATVNIANWCSWPRFLTVVMVRIMWISLSLKLVPPLFEIDSRTWILLIALNLMEGPPIITRMLATIIIYNGSWIMLTELKIFVTDPISVKTCSCWIDFLAIVATHYCLNERWHKFQGSFVWFMCE